MAVEDDDGCLGAVYVLCVVMAVKIAVYMLFVVMAAYIAVYVLVVVMAA